MSHPLNPLSALAAIVFLTSGLKAQVPAKCLEVESILGDACVSDADCPGSTEGMNEMVRFITGPAPIALADLQFAFYSSSFLGIVQDAATAAITSQLNASVEGCGLLVEPPGGIIPPGSRVIFITSTAMCVQANPFTALNDTLFVIFQFAGNSQGHFKNNDLVGQAVTTTPNAPLPRWLRVGVAGQCEDTVTYDANLLVNNMGTYGGTSSENDGATVEFSWPGTPAATYLNHGCMAAFEPTLPEVVSGQGAVACGASANLVATVAGNYASVAWQGGGGVFSNPDALATTYTPGAFDIGPVQLSFCAITACGDSVCTTATITVQSPALAATASSLQGCAPACITFTAAASGAASLLWDFGDGVTGQGPSVEHCFQNAGAHAVSVTADFGNGCTASASLADSIRIAAAPEAAFTWALDGPQAQFADWSTGAVAWLWLFGDTAGSSSAQPGPLFSYPGEGCYPVLLVVANAAGCQDSASMQLCIPGMDSLMVPNIFTPNNDGVNDLFRITGGRLASLDVQVFNRWGQEVARLQRSNQAWDGRTMAGEELSSGTYFYTLQALGHDGRVYEQNGTVTLVR